MRNLDVRAGGVLEHSLGDAAIYLGLVPPSSVP